jgi:hypothetical protein
VVESARSSKVFEEIYSSLLNVREGSVPGLPLRPRVPIVRTIEHDIVDHEKDTIKVITATVEAKRSMTDKLNMFHSIIRGEATTARTAYRGVEEQKVRASSPDA